MKELIGRNKTLCQFYCRAAHVLGWLLLVLGGIWAGIYYLRVVSRVGDWEPVQAELNSMPSGIFHFIMAGLVALGVRQFAAYILEADHRPGWILRHGEGILYLWAVLLVVSDVWSYTQDTSLALSNLYLRLLVGLLLVLLTAAKVLALVGLGQILRRVLPVIEESKTLV